jgi:hypothetical protein
MDWGVFEGLYSPAKSLEHLVGKVHPNLKLVRFFLHMFVYAHLPICQRGTERQAPSKGLPEVVLTDVLVLTADLMRHSQGCKGEASSLISDMGYVTP